MLRPETPKDFGVLELQKMQEALLDGCVGEIPGSGQAHRGCENSLEEPGLQYTTVLQRIKIRP